MTHATDPSKLPAQAEPPCAPALVISGEATSWTVSASPWLAPQHQQVWLMQQLGADLQVHLMTQEADGRVHDDALGPVVTLVGLALTDLIEGA